MTRNDHPNTSLTLIARPADQAIIVPGPTAAAIDRWIADWLLEKTNLSNSEETHATYAAILADYRTALLLQELDLDRFDRLNDLLTIANLFARFSARGKGVKPATIRLRLAAISSFYEFTVRQGHLPFNPIDRIKRPRQQRKQGAHPLSREAVTSYLARIQARNDANTHISPKVRSLLTSRDEAILLVYLETCRRLSEVASLTWASMQIEECLDEGGECYQGVKLSYHRLKGGKVAQDTLSPQTSEALLSWLRLFYGEPLERTMTPSSPLWVSLSNGGREEAPTSRGHGEGQALEKRPLSYGKQLGMQAIADLCKKYLGDSRVHVTRHTGAKLRVDEGADLRELKEKLGHSTLAVTDLYVEDLKSGVDPYAKRIGSLLVSKKQPRRE